MLPSGEHILEDVFQLAMFRKEELLDAPLFDEMSCSDRKIHYKMNLIIKMGCYRKPQPQRFQKKSTKR